MKSTKRILSAILSVVMILGCLTVGFTAQASGADLQKTINAAIAAGTDVDWKGGNVTLADTLVINGDVNIDFNGAVITGAPGKTAVEVKGTKDGNVTLYDGVVLADQGSFSGEMGFVQALMNYKPAIAIKGGNVELNCITAVGSLLRVPNSGTVELPIGNGIATDAGNVVLDNVIAIGMNALDNDNLSSNVVVKDAILAGIYKAVNRSSRVEFGGDEYTQYKTVDVLEGFLKEGVNLSANEKKYIDAATNSEGDVSVASVLINVKKPAFVQPETTFVNGKLNVIADVEAHEEEGVSNRYSYAYTPDTATIGNTVVDFKADGAQYVATFDDGLTAGDDYDVTVNYDLSIKLGKKQKEIVEKAFEILGYYIDKAPELLNRFVEDFDALYVKAEGLVAYAFNLIETGYVDGLDELLGLIYALEGQTFAGSDNGVVLHNYLYTDHYEKLGKYYKADASTFAQFENEVKKSINYEKTYFANNYGAIFDTDGEEGADSVFAYFYDETFEMKATFEETEFAKGTPGYGAGKGLLEVFNEYYEDIKALIYDVDKDGNITNTKEFKDLGAAAYYVGENWEGILELVENAVVVINKAYDIINGKGNSNAVNALLDKLVGTGDYSSVFKAFDKVYKYANLIIGKVDEVKATTFFKTFLENPATAAKYCKTYTEKVWNIANNPETYFDIVVDGDYVAVDLLDKDLNKTFTVSTEAKPVKVTVNVSGIGAAKLNDLEPRTSYDVDFAYGEDIVIEPVQTVEGASCVYMVVTSSGNMTVVDGDVFTAKAATNLEIDIVFQADDTLTTDAEIIFMTDKALNYNFLAKVQLAIDEIKDEWVFSVGGVIAPDFKGLTKTGWSLNKDGANAVKDVADTALASAVATAAADSDVVVVYANYTYDEQVEVKPQDEAIMMTSTSSEGGRAYFELTIQLPENSGAIEAGVIATLSEEYAKDLNTGLSGTEGVVFGRTSKIDADGYVMPNVLYTYGVKAPVGRTVYGRGYVVYENGNVEYTDVFEVVVVA